MKNIIDTIEAQRRVNLWKQGYWEIPDGIDTSDFNFDWRPHQYDRPYIHQFGTQWQKTGGPRFVIPENEGVKYQHHMIAKKLPDSSKFKILVNDYDVDFDWSWHPDETEPPFIWTFGNQFRNTYEMPTIEYHVDGSVDRKHVTSMIANLRAKSEYWNQLIPIEDWGWDKTWCPDIYDPPYIYVWGNQWNDAISEPTLEYRVPGATERKYMTNFVPRVKQDKTNWNILIPIDESTFDFSWRPSPHEPPYIYVWGNQWNDAIIEPTVEYRVPGATEYKYITDYTATTLPDLSRWNILIPIDESTFDFSWRPSPHEPPYIYVWGNQWNSAASDPTVEYRVPGATEYKYITDDVAYVLATTDNWKEVIPFDDSEFDFSWRPCSTEPPYIYVWGNQWNDATVESTLEYRVPGATERKYMIDTVKVLPDLSRWNILIPIDESTFDFSWRPNPYEPPYIYVWGNQWNDATIEPTVEYRSIQVEEQQYFRLPEKKYITDMIATVLPDRDRWSVPDNVNQKTIDFSWRPNPTDPPYIYHFPSQYHESSGVTYTVPEATKIKLINPFMISFKTSEDNWFVPDYIDRSTVDFSWRPSSFDDQYVYHFPSQHHVASGVTYTVDGATEIKLDRSFTVKALPTVENWTIPKNFDSSNFDFSWHPNPLNPPQIYQWINGGPIYTVPEATDVVLMEDFVDHIVDNVNRYYVETTLEDLIKLHPNEVFWALNPDLKYDNFDFSWRPTSINFRHINVFGNKITKDTGTYYVNAPMYMSGHRELNYIDDYEVTISTDLDMFYVVIGHDESDDRFEKLKNIYPKLQKTRFLGSWVNTISRCLRKSSSRFVWILSSDCDYSDFKFDYYPSSWVQDKIHIFGNQWTHWGNTYLVNREQFDKDTQYVKVIEHLTNVNHVRSKRVTRLGHVTEILYIDHENVTDSLDVIKSRHPSARVTVLTYNNSYLNTITEWVSQLPEYYVREVHPLWICSSICNYDDFDFSWVPDPFQMDQLHVFSSQLEKTKQKFGDTFFVDLKILKDELPKLTDLEDYGKKINYISYLSAKRWTHSIIRHDHDSQVDAVTEFKNNFSGPYIELINDSACPEVKRLVPNVWNLNRSAVMVGTTGASQILVPRSAFDKIDLEVYDYPYIDVVDKPIESVPIDIVFISNGEPVAEENYRLLEQTFKDKKILNRLHWVRDVKGRVASQQSAARTSVTDWYFLVNGKIRINPEFDWTWQPDRLQQAKHYIFTATNPVNGLEYGHQAIVANNRRLTLETKPTGLDFTLESLHAVVERNCGVAIYNTDPWTTWRTAFREAIKLRDNTDDVSRERLDVWCTVGNGDFGEWSTRGALDAVEYYDSVDGKLEDLMKSYDWAWLQERYRSRYDQ